MFQGLLRPLPSHLSLRNLLYHTRSTETLGVWLSGCSQRQRIYAVRVAGGSLHVSADLGLLLARCCRIAVRQGERPVVLEADTLLQWRALQVATAPPYLPGLARLRALFPGLHATTNGLLVPVRQESPEEVLALCVEEGVRVTGSRIVYVAPVPSFRLPP